MGRQGARRGSANVGVLKGSPLSPVVFLIWMAPILEKMEGKMREEAGVGAGVAGAETEIDVELPSFVDDMCTDIVVWEGSSSNMQRVETNVKRVVREVAEEEVLHLRKSRKKKNAGRKYAKWLGVIFDDL